MGGASVRTGFTSRGTHGLDGWKDTRYIYSVFQINLGNNPTYNLEVVSSLNLFNLARYMYYVEWEGVGNNYSPKVYLSTVQSLSNGCIYDGNPGLKSEQKSGSWPFIVN